MMPKPSTRRGRIIEGVIVGIIGGAAGLGVLIIILGPFINWVIQNVHFKSMIP